MYYIVRRLPHHGKSRQATVTTSWYDPGP